MVNDSDEQMDPGARRVVALARSARTPSDADKRRVRQALALGVGAATAGVSAGTALASATKVGVLVGLRGIIAALVVATAGTGTYFFARSRVVAPRVVAPAAPVAAPVVVPLVPLPVAPAAAVVPSPDPLLAELSLLRQAQQALRDGQARRALELAERHASLYPRSQLAFERGALRVFAFCALGRKADARALANDLLAAAPRSPLRTSLEESCAMR
ncbi:MAG TPA: hypothetical protein VLA14_15670 [Polyangia bacterium]|nr:hypothetical protein [Polyangia bacterium]